MLPALLTTLLWASGAAVSYRLARLLGSEAANFWRLLLAALLLGTWVHGFGNGPARVGAGWLLLSGLVGFGVGDVALYAALPRIGSRLTLLMVQCLAAPIGILVGFLWLGQTLSFREAAAAALILGGVGVALAPGSHSIPKGHLLAGIAWGFLAACGQAFGALLSSRAMHEIQAAGGAVDGVQAAYGRIWGGVLVAFLYLALSVWRGRSGWFSAQRGRSESPRAVAPWLLGTALLGPVLGVSCYQWALGTTATGIVLAIVATTPLVAIPFAWHMEADKPGWRSVLGGAVAVVGVLLLAG